jgi:hypothetical protein
VPCIQHHVQAYQSQPLIMAPHPADQLQFLNCVLIWMTMRSVASLIQGFNGSIVSFLPSIDACSAYPVSPRYRCDCSAFHHFLQYPLTEECLLSYSFHARSSFLLMLFSLQLQLYQIFGFLAFFFPSNCYTSFYNLQYFLLNVIRWGFRS